MSYAGPASRGKRANDTQLVATRLATPPAPATAVAPRNHRVRPTESRSMVFAAGMLLGLAVGAGITLLVAPRSGEETRHALARRGRRLRARGHDAWDDLRDELHDVVHRRRLARQCRKLEAKRDAS